jgi:hypothetical protein
VRASFLSHSCSSTFFSPFVFAGSGARGLFVKVESTPNPDSVKFMPEDREVLPEKFGTGMVRVHRGRRLSRDVIPPFTPPLAPTTTTTQQFSDIGQAKGSKLVRRLLKIEQVTGVFLGRDFISVNKKEETPWTVRVVVCRQTDGTTTTLAPPRLSPSSSFHSPFPPRSP